MTALQSVCILWYSVDNQPNKQFCDLCVFSPSDIVSPLIWSLSTTTSPCGHVSVVNQTLASTFLQVITGFLIYSMCLVTALILSRCRSLVEKQGFFTSSEIDVR